MSDDRNKDGQAPSKQSQHSVRFVMPSGEIINGVRWVNPDGKLGGWVAVSAKIDPSAIIEVYARVGPGVEVPANTIVRNGTRLLPQLQPK